MQKYFNHFISLFLNELASAYFFLFPRNLSIEGTSFVYERPGTISEQDMSDISVANVEARLNSKGIEKESDEALEYLSRNKPFYLKPKLEVAVKDKLVNTVRKKRILTYKLHDINGLVLYEGVNFKEYMIKASLYLPFDYKAAYYYANKYQGEKTFRQNYLISFKEIN